MSFDDDLIDNPSPRCPCVLVLDTSGSMDGAPIRQLNDGVMQFINSLQKDEVAANSVEVAILTAGGNVREVRQFSTANSLDFNSTFVASGNTPLGEAVNEALDMLEARKEEYKSNGVAYYQPWLVVISDGEPTDYYRDAADRARSMGEQRKLTSLIIGVNNANKETLQLFSNRAALHLDGLKFSEFFEWLSASMSAVSNSGSTTESVALPPRGDWNDDWDTV